MLLLVIWCIRLKENSDLVQICATFVPFFFIFRLKKIPDFIMVPFPQFFSIKEMQPDYPSDVGLGWFGLSVKISENRLNPIRSQLIGLGPFFF